MKQLSHLDHVIGYLEQSDKADAKAVSRYQKTQKYDKIIGLILDNDIEYNDFLTSLADSSEPEDEEKVRNFFHSSESQRTSEADFVEVLKRHNHVYCHAYLAKAEI